MSTAHDAHLTPEQLLLVKTWAGARLRDIQPDSISVRLGFKLAEETNFEPALDALAHLKRLAILATSAPTPPTTEELDDALTLQFLTTSAARREIAKRQLMEAMVHTEEVPELDDLRRLNEERKASVEQINALRARIADLNRTLDNKLLWDSAMVKAREKKSRQDIQREHDELDSELAAISASMAQSDAFYKQHKASVMRGILALSSIYDDLAASTAPDNLASRIADASVVTSPQPPRSAGAHVEPSLARVVGSATASEGSSRASTPAQE
ncbi:hypothetical protein BC828DRAFT_402590 [Blastocladiella britannica]|nr:hypothetical protein BC828DRAFT_402590 [Blastocladiella britannica]